MAGDSVKMHVLMDHYNCLQLTLEECHAVTPNGMRIQIITSQEGQTLTLSKDMTEMKGNATFSVFISAKLFKPTPYGEAAAQEYPPRIPFLRPTYSLNIMDYENRERFEVTGNTDKNKHKRKSFFKWQWDIIREQMEAL